MPHRAVSYAWAAMTTDTRSSDHVDVEQLALHVRELQTAINLMAGAALRTSDLDPKMRARLARLLEASRQMHATAESMASALERSH